jgi:hypothetical protein
MCRIFVPALILIIPPLGSTVWAQGGKNPGRESGTADVKAFDFLLTGMKQERLKLISGMCRFKGESATHWPKKPEDNLDGLLVAFMAFDNGKARFDITKPGYVIDPDSIQFVGAKSGQAASRAIASRHKGTLSRKFADDKTRVTVWHSDNSLVSIAQARDFADRTSTGYFDIRGINVYDSLQLKRGYSFERMFEEYAKIAPKASIREMNDSTWSVRWEFRDEHLISKWSFVVDVRSGFTPMEYKCETASVKEMQDPNKWFLEYELKTTWEERNGVWVPTRHSSYKGGLFHEYIESFSYDIEWEKVNEPVNTDLFGYATFEIPDHVGITDFSGGQQVVIKPISAAVSEDFTRNNPSRHLLWGLLGGGIGLLLAHFGIRRFRRSV